MSHSLCYTIIVDQGRIYVGAVFPSVCTSIFSLFSLGERKQLSTLAASVFYAMIDVQALLDAGKEHAFYMSSDWQRVRARVLAMDHYECQHCKARGRYAPATHVHHVKHLKERPDLALSIYDEDTGQRQLVSLCFACHREEHPEMQRVQPSKPAFRTRERWD